MDLLWKRNPVGELVDIFSNVDWIDPLSWEIKIMSGVERSKKKNKTSTSLRELGNKKIQEQNYYLAMFYYNVSLCYAEIGTDNVSLAYANRSFCFLKLKKYDKCLIDIELAINANYPPQLMGKLGKRREFCLKQLNSAPSDDLISPKLDFDADENFPGMSIVMQMECNEKFGRHFVAKSDIDAGKVVMVEEAFVFASEPKNKSRACETCLKHSTNFIACPKCNGALFCNEICADDFLHVWRCGRGARDDDFLVEFTLRSVMHAMTIFDEGIDHLKNFVEKVIQQPKREKVPKTLIGLTSRYRMFLELNLWLSEAEKQRVILTGYEAYQLLIRKSGIKEFIGGQDVHHFLMHLFVMHASIILCNIFQNQVNGTISLLLNHFNHSCAPNVLRSSYENKTVVVTSRRIKKGDQLFASYGEQYFLESRANRQTQLYKGFGFHCECEKCQNHEWPISSDGIESDPDYQFLLKDSKNWSIYEVTKRLALKKKCLEILVKYSDSIWCTQLDTVSYLYEYLSTETFH